MARKLSSTPDASATRRHKRTRLTRIDGISVGSAGEHATIASPTNEGPTKEQNVVLDVGFHAPQGIFRPRVETQLSILSTDSGFLPKDIQNSSFVDDVIEELKSKGISHSDIICCQDCHPDCKELSTPNVSCAKEPSICKHKSKEARPTPMDAPAKKKLLLQLGSGVDPGTGINRRQRNNEASRRSRVSRKMNMQMKEDEIAQLEEENRRLTILLDDFGTIATSCKQWIVRNMEHPC